MRLARRSVARALLVLLLALVLLVPARSLAQAPLAESCSYQLGFAALRQAIADSAGSDIVGSCLEDEQHFASGDAIQRTGGGVLSWRKADNWTGFTDGYRTWVAGPSGVETRLAGELLAWEEHASGTMYQVSTLDALMAGDYAGSVSLGRLRQRGDFGLGTFDALDGEMIVLDGVIYQARADGSVAVAPDGGSTPFAAVTFFRPQQTLAITAPLAWDQLPAYVDSLLPVEHLMYALRLDGSFAYVKVRSVPAQTAPYLPLAQVVAEQQVTFELQDVEGTLVGLRFPETMGGVNMAGYHFHFLTDARDAGGHVLTAQLREGTLSIATIAAFEMALPMTAPADVVVSLADVAQVEQGR